MNAPDAAVNIVRDASARLEAVGSSELAGLLYSLTPEIAAPSRVFTTSVNDALPPVCTDNPHLRNSHHAHLRNLVSDGVITKTKHPGEGQYKYSRIADKRTLAMAGAMLDLSIESPMYLGRLWGDKPFRDFKGEKPRIRFLRAITAHPEGVAQKRLSKLMEVPDTTHVQQHLRPFVRLGMAVVERIPAEQGYYFTARATRLIQPYLEIAKEGLRRLDENASASETELAVWADRAQEIAENKVLVAKLFEKPYDTFFPHNFRTRNK